MSSEPPPRETSGAADVARAVARGVPIAVLLLCGVAATLLLRLVEWPLHGRQRPWTPYITQWVCAGAFRILGISHAVSGNPMREPGAIVCNHVSWLDILALNACKRVYFVSKSEVARWPVIGGVARMVGTVFIDRDPKGARMQTALLEDRLMAGHRLLFFPEGSSTDGMRVLPFRPTLFQTFLSPALRETVHVQPVSVIYHAPEGLDARFYGWWGDMSLAAHLLQVLGARRQGSVRIVYHPPLKVSCFSDRKTLAATCEAQVRAGMPEDRRGT